MNAHCRAVINYQKRHPEKVRAQQKAQKYPHLLIVLYECSHDAAKENHHPDYSKWREVHKLCRDCHKKIPKSPRIDCPEVISPKEIREIRISLGMSQWGFSGFIGTTLVSVNRWENGRSKPSEKYIKRLTVLNHGNQRKQAQ